jgi:hypothetical protein
VKTNLTASQFLYISLKGGSKKSAYPPNSAKAEAKLSSGQPVKSRCAQQDEVDQQSNGGTEQNVQEQTCTKFNWTFWTFIVLFCH